MRLSQAEDKQFKWALREIYYGVQRDRRGWRVQHELVEPSWMFLGSRAPRCAVRGLSEVFIRRGGLLIEVDVPDWLENLGEWLTPYTIFVLEPADCRLKFSSRDAVRRRGIDIKGADGPWWEAIRTELPKFVEAAKALQTLEKHLKDQDAATKKMRQDLEIERARKAFESRG